jgi:hypothetical protein
VTPGAAVGWRQLVVATAESVTAAGSTGAPVSIVGLGVLPYGITRRLRGGPTDS